MFTGRPVRTGRAVLVAGVLLVLSAVGFGVTALVRASDPGRSPLHRAVDAYLETVGTGGSAPAATCAGTSDPAAELRRQGARFGHRIVSSTEGGGQATVNVDLTPGHGPAVAYSLDLSRTGTVWEVCSASPGHMEIDPFG
ncbi:MULTISPECIES: hypothetical protein [unclassified Streptomyces]|uniref:hypothetical protein n=1 Tax=unclassified Streptomyces TaxID=2593676 RepID=UPI002E2BD1A0|nr:hypothetical protein [Streptomyces sp. NBC_00272]